MQNPVRITSWNVNGLRACARKGFADWLATCGAEIVALQEVRARPDQLAPELCSPEGWHTAWSPAERPGYSGVGVLARQPPTALETRLGREEFDREGRLQFARFGALTVVNGYFPNGNGKNRDLSRIPYKLDFYRTLFDHLEPARRAGEAILVMGDFNTCHRDLDLARPQQNRETSGFRPEEREELDRWLREGWTDTYRHLHPEKVEYSWWSQRKGVREKNIGWRLDMVLASPGALEHVRDAAIHTEVMGSDHCPVSVTVDSGIFPWGPPRSWRRRGLVQDQAGAALVSKVVQGPLKEHHEAVAEADQEDDVDQQPGHPGGKAGEPEAAQHRHRRLAPEGGHGTLILIAERLGRFAAEGALDIARRVEAHLDGRWSDPGHRFPSLFQRDHVADGKDCLLYTSDAADEN